jgi:hypothetical protein
VARQHGRALVAVLLLTLAALPDEETGYGDDLDVADVEAIFGHLRGDA